MQLNEEQQMNPLMAKSKSLQNLISSMDEEEMKKVPGLTIEIITGPGMNGESESDNYQEQNNPEEEEFEHALGELQNHGANPDDMEQNPMNGMSGSMFDDLIRRKKMGTVK
jgi:hypothetical protein